jgi:precorrin-4/cobalt-precorrin-4 C11-methyltransferase
MSTHVFFIGAGPGDPELLTIKARRIIKKADVIIYADSLVNPDICNYAKKGAAIHKSSALSLEETTDIIIAAVKESKTVARLQSGDPGIYGAIHEQMAALDKQLIEYEIIPGVSSLFASAATLKKELTVPGMSQTVIITRMEGNTPVPAGERLKDLAAHKATLAIFLSIPLIDKVVLELLASHLEPNTPVAVVYKASWKDEKVLFTRLKNLADDVKKAGIKRQALIMVGDFLQSKGRSKLYDRNFVHGYRPKK